MNKYNLGQKLITHGLRGDSHFLGLVGEVARIEKQPIDGTPIYTLEITQGIVNRGAVLTFREENLRPA